MNRSILFQMVGVCVLCLVSVAQACGPTTVGVIGDSLSDEYEFADGGNHSAGMNWVEQLAWCPFLDFGDFSETGWGYPRDQGYEYNWARAGATSADLLSQGQHTGLAAQIAAGDVDLAVCWVGVNDLTKVYSGHYQYIYGGGDWVPMVNAAVANATTAVNTLLAADEDLDLVLVTIPDVELNPALRAAFPNAEYRQRVSDAIASYNSLLISEIADGNPRIAVADVYRQSLNILDLLDAGQNLWVGGFEVDLNKVGDDLDCIILADQIHPGTIAQGLMAWEIYNAMAELGYGPALPPPPVPEPATLCVLACGGWLCLRRRKR